MANTSTTINVFDLKEQKDLPFTLQEDIEKGLFGQVALATTPTYKEPLIAKTIDLQGKSELIHYSPHHLLRLTYREIAYLKQLDLLVGYQHDTKNKKMLIIMKHLPGIREYDVAPKTKCLAQFASFCALRNMHRQGIAHMDPHAYNFLYDEKTDKAYAIDFGFSQDAHYFRQLRDFKQFLELRRAPPSFMSKEGRATLWYFLDFYLTELKDHILAHRYETAKTVFCYAAVIIAALSGVSVLGVVSLLAQELIKATLMAALSDLLATFQDHYEFRAFNQKNSTAYRAFHFALAGILIVLQGVIVAFQINSLLNLSGKVLTELAAFPIVDAATLGIQLQAWVNTFQYWLNNGEKYLFPEKLITYRYQHKIASINTKSFITVDTQNHPHSSALPRI